MAGPKEMIAALFGRTAAVYDEIEPRMFQHFGRRLVELADLPPGADVLDVATGKGAVLFPAAERAARVIGTDLAEPMVAQTEARIREQGIENAEVRVMDAELLDFRDESFDAVLCGFAIFFLPEPERALAEFRRVLRPGGIAGLTIFAGPREERWSWLRDLQAALAPEAMHTRVDPERFRSGDDLRRELRDAGFESIRIEEETLDGSWEDAEHWLRWSWTHGHRRFLEGLDEDQLARFRDEAFPKLELAREADGRIHALFTAVFGFGRKP